MTCIVGVKDKGKVYIGADSAVSFGSLTHTLVADKVFKKKGMLVGYCGGYRHMQQIQYDMSYPKDSHTDPLKYLIKQFVPSLIKCLKPEDEDEKLEFGIMVGYKGRLFEIDAEFSVVEVNADFLVNGTGNDIALGVMYATKNLPVKKRITLALEAACQYDVYCSEPLIIKSI